MSAALTLARAEGPNLVLRLIQPGDAAYLHALRTDAAYNEHLSPVQGTAEDQRRWIEAYTSREAEGREFYYIVERRDGTPCGTVRLYNIRPDGFTWGSWILDRNKPRRAALESAVLSFGIGFDVLGLDQADLEVRAANRHATSFYRRFGMTEVGGTAQDLFFVYPKARFLADRPGHLAVLREADGQ
ncbi:N-acetyltransferase [Ancylobacter aquaticus]|nr:N-acetyltransferase [Ancylobacter aquaticus]